MKTHSMQGLPDTSWDPQRPDITAVLAEARLQDLALIHSASNAVFLLELAHPDAGTGYAIYKPQRGETPLWDFPPDLYRREYATYLVSRALGWALAPPTVIREEGLPHGVGSVQCYIPADFECTYFDLRAAHADALRRFALFDWIINNADRKGGHVLRARDGHLWGIDHGLTFHEDDKLRTVIWDFAGEPAPAPLLAEVEVFQPRLEDAADPVTQELDRLLSRREMAALRRRVRDILEQRVFPPPPSHRRPYPWPLV